MLRSNRQAQEQIPGPCELAVVAGAGHLFEEPGALAEAAELAGEWFVEKLGAAKTAAAPGTVELDAPAGDNRRSRATADALLRAAHPLSTARRTTTTRCSS